MAKYTVNCDWCENDFTTSLFGAQKARQWKLENFAWVCDLCKVKANKEYADECTEENKEQGLPQLTGSEKQIAWAEKIRRSFYSQLSGNKFIKLIHNEIFPWQSDSHLNGEADESHWQEVIRESKKRGLDFEVKCENALVDIFENSSASFWIDHRDQYALGLWKEFYRKAQTTSQKAEHQESKKLEEEAKAEATVRPEDVKTETVAEITFNAKQVKVCFPERREDFRLLIKDLGFSWLKGYWRKDLSFRTGEVAERVAEIGNKLLNTGFLICIYDDKIREGAIASDYSPEQTRWISQNADKGNFLISWKRYHEDYYSVARSLPGSKWSSPYVIVSSEHFEAIEEFAETYNFSFSPGAIELISKAREEKAKQSCAKISKSKSQAFKTATTEKPVLELEVFNIDPSLLDDEV